MSSPPAFLSVVLEEDDVRADLVSIVESMRAIRQEEVKDGEVSDQAKDEYLHLSYRLASTLEGLMNDTTIPKMQKMVDIIKKDPFLRTYDALQDSFWAAAEPEFSTTLDETVISFMEDDFAGLQDKHHFFNALKYIASQDDPLAERIEMYNTILPEHPPKNVQQASPKSWDHLKKFCKVVKPGEGWWLEAKKVTDLDGLLSHAAYLGLNRVYVRMSETAYSSIQSKYKKAIVVDALPSSGSSRSRSEKRARYARLGIALTNPISQQIISGLPTSMVKRLNTYFKNNGARPIADQFEAYLGFGGFYDFVCSAGLVWGSVRSYSYLWFSEPPNWDGIGILLLGGLFGASGLSRILTTMYRSVCKIEYKIQDPRGSNALISLPFVGMVYAYDKLPKKSKEKKKDLTSYAQGGQVIVEFPLSEPVEKKGDASNYHSMLERLAAHPLPEEVEDNLVWSLTNHYQQGKAVMEHFKKSKLYPSSFQDKVFLNQEKNALVSSNTFRSGPYTKVSALVTFPGKRYALTMIGSGDKVEDALAITNWLAVNKVDNESKKKEFAEVVGAHYLHLSCFEEGAKTQNYTLTL